MIVSTHKRGFSIERTGKLRTFSVIHEKYGACGYYATEAKAREHIASCHMAFRRNSRYGCGVHRARWSELSPLPV